MEPEDYREAVADVHRLRRATHRPTTFTPSGKPMLDGYTGTGRTWRRYLPPMVQAVAARVHDPAVSAEKGTWLEAVVTGAACLGLCVLIGVVVWGYWTLMGAFAAEAFARPSRSGFPMEDLLKPLVSIGHVLGVLSMLVAGSAVAFGKMEMGLRLAIQAAIIGAGPTVITLLMVR